MKINNLTHYKIIKVVCIIYIVMSFVISNTMGYHFFCTCTRVHKNTRVVPIKNEILPSTAEALNGQLMKKSTPTVIKAPDSDICYTTGCVHAGNI